MSCGDPYKLFSPAKYSGITLPSYSGGAPSHYRKSDFYAPSGGYLPNFGNRDNLAFTLSKYEFEKKEEPKPFGDSFGDSDGNSGGVKETKIYTPKQDEKDNNIGTYNSIQNTLKIKGMPHYQTINSSFTNYQPIKEQMKGKKLSRDDKVLTDFLSGLTKKEEIDSLTSKLVATIDGGIETLR